MTAKSLLTRPHEAAGLQSGTATLVVRPVKPQPPVLAGSWYQRKAGEWGHDPKHPDLWHYVSPSGKENHVDPLRCPFAVGQRLAVKETWTRVPTTAYRASDGIEYTVCPADPAYCAVYKVGWTRSAPHWLSGATMPLWAVRTYLTVTSVACVRLHSLSREQIDAMGLGNPTQQMSHRNDLYQLSKDLEFVWNRTYGRGAWEQNPWVWCWGVTKA